MIDDTIIDSVFADLEDGHEKFRVFIKEVSCLLAGGEVQLWLNEEQNWIPVEIFPEFSKSDRKKLLKKIERQPLVRVQTDKSGEIYGIAVPSIEVVMLVRFSGGEFNLVDSPIGSSLLQNTINLALLKCSQQDIRIENEQLSRQIDALNRQHGKLIEDNYRQYRVIQDKEKSYARKLEQEIARQTAELRETNRKLEDASRMKSEFLANMSHELRTPMNAINGFSDLLIETELDEEQYDYVKTISGAADSLLNLINDILDLAKIEAGKLELENVSFELFEVIERAVAMFKIPARNKNIDLSFVIDPIIPPELFGDSNRLRQIIVNLISNAMKFTESGQVVVKVELVEHGVLNLLRFSVRDTGIGIPSDRKSAIFEKFVQADGSTTRKYGGTGLGLAICAQLVELMQGKIGVESEVGKGSVFFFTIPLLSPVVGHDRSASLPAVDHQEQAPEVLFAGRERPRVLIVEDNKVNQKLAVIIVKRQGCDVEVAGDGLEALQILERERFDLVLMDVQMPNLDGIEATKRIRALEMKTDAGGYVGLSGEKLVIVGLTAHARKEDRDECLAVGMNDFLTKPIIKDKLTAVLRKYIPRN
ncbi:MAG: response regulator [Proteobacteria bacterium]|nr:response regulator [Pseudomonadota bacterium]MBU1716090.1 response regulator [Pseudomonadota bacterium]